MRSFIVDSHITTDIVEYPEGQLPDLLLPKHDKEHCFFIGRSGERPLVALTGLPPATVDKAQSCEMLNTVIKTGKKLGNDGWMLFHLYPEKAEAAESIEFDPAISDKNVRHLERFILNNEIQEIWGIWDDSTLEAVTKGKLAILEMLKKHNVRVFYFGTLTENKNPRDPLQKEEYWHMFNPNKMFL